MIRAVSVRPHAPSARTITTPAPGEAPACARPARLKGRPNCPAGTQVPKKPPTSAAAGRPTGAARPTIASSGVPTGTSITPGRTTAPLTVTRAVPGSSGLPDWRNHTAPLRAIWARCARVSTFWTSVGRLPTPLSKGRGGAVVGRDPRRLGRRPLGQGPVHRPQRLGGGLLDPDHHPVGPHRCGGEQGAVED